MVKSIFTQYLVFVFTNCDGMVVLLYIHFCLYQARPQSTAWDDFNYHCCWIFKTFHGMPQQTLNYKRRRQTEDEKFDACQVVTFQWTSEWSQYHEKKMYDRCETFHWRKQIKLDSLNSKNYVTFAFSLGLNNKVEENWQFFTVVASIKISLKFHLMTNLKSKSIVHKIWLASSFIPTSYSMLFITDELMELRKFQSNL